MKENIKRPINLTLDPDIIDKMKDYAKKDSRSISMFLNMYLRENFMKGAKDGTIRRPKA